jgi:hypothetical protein
MTFAIFRIAVAFIQGSWMIRVLALALMRSVRASFLKICTFNSTSFFAIAATASSLILGSLMARAVSLAPSRLTLTSIFTIRMHSSIHFTA